MPVKLDKIIEYVFTYILYCTIVHMYMHMNVYFTIIGCQSKMRRSIDHDQFKLVYTISLKRDFTRAQMSTIIKK